MRNIIEKLKGLHVPESNLESVSRIVGEANSPQKAEEMLAEIRSGGNFEQMILPSFRKLYLNNLKVKMRALLYISQKTGIGFGAVKKYLFDLGNQPSGFAVENLGITREQQRELVDASRRIMLKELREYCDIK